MARDDEELKKLLLALAQFSEETKKILVKVNLENYEKVLNAISQIERELPSQEAAMNSIFNFEKNYSKLQASIVKILSESYQNSGVLDDYSHLFISEYVKIQSEMAVLSRYDKTTELIQDVYNYFSKSNIEGCLTAIQKSLKKVEISAADFAFFKTSEIVRGLKNELRYPKGFLTDVKEINVSSAIHLFDSTTIQYRNDKRCFVNTEGTNSFATMQEMNVICGAKEVFRTNPEGEELSENELMDFMTLLDNHPTMAMRSETGQKIFNIISNMPNIIEFDKKLYYHSRARDKTETPYVWEQMKKAPYGVTFSGRYNHMGQAFFYFADTKIGAEKEIMKHMSMLDREKKVIQTVEIGTNGKAKLLDLSAKEMRGLNVFLRFIRFPLEGDKSMRPRAYLIPSFVSDCCSESGYDGIKYYGGKDYSNYVTWSDGFYEFIRNI